MKYPLRLAEYCCRFSSITLLLFFKNDSEFCGCYYYYYYYYYYSIIANLMFMPWIFAWTEQATILYSDAKNFFSLSFE